MPQGSSWRALRRVFARARLCVGCAGGGADAVRVPCRQRDRRNGSRRARRHRQDYPRRDQPDPRRRPTNATGGYNFPEHSYRHLPGRRDAHRVPVGQLARHHRPAEHVGPRRRAADGRRAAGDGARLGHGGGAPDRNRGGADADDERADRQPADGRPLVSELHVD